MPTKIEWTNETWNPIVGCSHISPGCEHCYAERMANRLSSIALKDDSSDHFSIDSLGKYAMVTLDGEWNDKTWFSKIDLEKPLKWKKPRMIFVVSMGDLFHESVPFEWIDRVFYVIAEADQHTYLLLTKRPERMREFFESYLERLNMHNVWLGITAENQEMADLRIPVLLQIPTAKRFVSIEPMLGPVNLRGVGTATDPIDCLNGIKFMPGFHGKLGDCEKLDWVIVGGETGCGFRQLDNLEWVRSIRDQCQKAGVPFFFKSWGGKNRKEHLIEGKEWREMP